MKDWTISVGAERFWARPPEEYAGPQGERFRPVLIVRNDVTGFTYRPDVFGDVDFNWPSKAKDYAASFIAERAYREAWVAQAIAAQKARQVATREAQARWEAEERRVDEAVAPYLPKE